MLPRVIALTSIAFTVCTLPISALPLYSAEAQNEYLTAFRQSFSQPSLFISQAIADVDALRLGYSACAALEAGEPIERLVKNPTPSEIEETRVLAEILSSAIAVSAANHLCPQHSWKAQQYFTQYGMPN